MWAFLSESHILKYIHCVKMGKNISTGTYAIFYLIRIKMDENDGV